MIDARHPRSGGLFFPEKMRQMGECARADY